jgi:hypothetical protein
MWLCGSFGGGAYTPKDLCAHRSGVSTLVRRFQCWDPPNREMFATTTTIRCTNEGRKVCNLITSPRWFSNSKTYIVASSGDVENLYIKSGSFS